MNTAYIVAGYRSAVGKSAKGFFKSTRPDDLAADVIKHLVASVPELDKEKIDDVICGNATPEAEQGLNIGRMISLMGLDTIKVPGMTINRYCSSGLEAIAIANAKIQSGMAECIIAGGVECMSAIPFGGWRIVPNYTVAKHNTDWYWNMGLTAEAVAEKWKISRKDQDEFAFNSHQKALNAIKKGYFKSGIAPITIKETYLDENEKRQEREFIVDTDEGPRKGGSAEALAKLRTVFSQKGTVTAANASQTSDGAAFLILISERMVKELDIKPIAKLLSYSVAGVEPKLMGIGPVKAVPLALKKAGLKLEDIEQFELNEAFASQSLACIKDLKIDQKKVNLDGGALALGHPLGATGARITGKAAELLKRENKKYALSTQCIGLGMGIATIIESIN